MNDVNEAKLRALLRRAMAPVAQPELERDLWPQMLRRLDERAFRLVWFEWALLALTAALVYWFPEVIPGLLYLL